MSNQPDPDCGGRCLYVGVGEMRRRRWFMFVVFGSSVDYASLLSRNRRCVPSFLLSAVPPLSHLANGQPLQSDKLNVVGHLLQMERSVRKAFRALRIGIRKTHELSWPRLRTNVSNRELIPFLQQFHPSLILTHLLRLRVVQQLHEVLLLDAPLESMLNLPFCSRWKGQCIAIIILSPRIQFYNTLQ